MTKFFYGYLHGKKNRSKSLHSNSEGPTAPQHEKQEITWDDYCCGRYNLQSLQFALIR